MTDSASGTPSLDERELFAHTAFLERLARRLVGDVHVAQDLVQETLTIAVAGEGRGSGEDRAGGGRGDPSTPVKRGGNLRAWLAGVLRNRARMRWRSETRRERREAFVAVQAQAMASPACGPDEIAARLEMQETLLREVRALPPPYREVVVRRFYENRTPDEIARLLEVPASTVRTRLQRALARLREALDRKTNGDRGVWCAALLGLPVGSVRVGDGTRGGGGRGWAGYLGAGIVAMTSKKSLIAAGVLLALVVVSGVLGTAGRWGTSPLESADVGAGVEDAGGTKDALSTRRRAAVTEQTVTVDSSLVPDLSQPTGLDAREIDRDQDLHGIVFDPDGVPFPGARVQALEKPWGRTVVFRIVDATDSVPGPSEVTGEDGVFALRLRRGARVSLTVYAEGYADMVIPWRQAGERVDVVLQEAASLTVRVRDETGAPVPRARVSVWRRSDGKTPVFSHHADTDVEGRARFPGLTAGRTRVRAEHQALGCPAAPSVDLVPGAENEVDVEMVVGRELGGIVVDRETKTPIAGARVGEGWDLRRAVESDVTGMFVLRGYVGRAGAEVHCTAPGYGRAELVPQDGKALLFALRRGDDVVGRVLGADGEPLAGALLTALAYEFTNGADRLDSISDRTAVDGSFRLTGLRRDMSHTVVVQSPGHGMLRIDVHPRVEGPGVIALGDIRMPEGSSLAGRVIAADGKSVPGAPVVLRPLSPRAAHALYGGLEERPADDLGRYRFSDLAPDSYEVTVRIPGRPEVTRRLVLEVGEPVEDFDVELPAVRELDVTVVDEHGVPIPGAALHVSSPDHAYEARTDDRGRARLASTTEGPWTVRAWPPRGKVQSLRYMKVVLDGVRPEEGPLEIALPTAGLVRGRVRGPDGRPLSRMFVLAYRDDARACGGDTVTDETGAFELPVPVGDGYRIVVDGRRQKPESWIFVETLAVRGQIVDVAAPSQGHEIRTVSVPADQSLTVVVRSPDGRPVAGARVVVTDRLGAGTAPDDARSGTSDRQGRVHFEALRGQLCRVWVSHTEATRSLGEIVRPNYLETVPAGQTVELSFRRGAVLAGLVKDPDGTALEGVRVRLITADGVELGIARTDVEGRFSLLGLAGHGHQLAITLRRTADRDRYDVVRGVRPGEDLVFELE